LLRATLDVLEGRVPLARFRPGADPFAGLTERAPGVYVHPSARVDVDVPGPALIGEGTTVAKGARLGTAIVLGKNVRIDAGADVERAAIWDGTHVAAGERVIDQIAAPGVRVDV
jgi:mannose-1-phosphate guanylyltransferase